jgi:hypothetical protein
MEEHGVSKIVSVKFHKADESAPVRETALPMHRPVHSVVPETGHGQSIENGHTNGNGNGHGDSIDVVMAK